MTITWPASLVAELAERRCVVVLGAGASAGCESTNPPGGRPKQWKSFLEAALKVMRDKADAEEASRLIEKEQYLDAAQIVVDGSDSAQFSLFLREQLKLPRYKPSRIHECVLALDPKIVITTNYDEIYDEYCKQGSAIDGYNVCRYYETHAINDIRSTTRLVLKAHGCVSDASKIVLSRRQYFDARRLYSSFYEILDAIFLTSTLLFVGCGLTDPDIQLILENVHISAHSTHPHYALVESGRHRSIVRAIRDTYNLELLEYPAGQHDVAAVALEQLHGRVESYRAIPR